MPVLPFSHAMRKYCTLPPVAAGALNAERSSPVKLSRWPALSGPCHVPHRHNHGLKLVSACPGFTLPRRDS